MSPFIYATASVLIVSAISLAGLFTISAKEERLKRVLFILIALAIGALLGDAFVHLIPEAIEVNKNIRMVSGLVIIGIVVFFAIEKVLHWHHHEEQDTVPDILPVGKLILFSDGLHNFIDGCIIAVSYLADVKVGIATTIAIILHEIPQEIGDFGILLHAGYTRNRALLFNFLSALLAVLGTLAVFLLGANAEQFVNTILPFAAGSLIYIAMSDLVPELHKSRGVKRTLFELILIGAGIGIMYLLLLVD